MGLIHLDAGVIIGLLDAADAHHESATEALAGAIRSGNRVAMAASAFAECLVGPSRRGRGAVETVNELFARLPIEVVDLDADIARVAASIRAKHTSHWATLRRARLRCSPPVTCKGRLLSSRSGLTCRWHGI